MDDFDFLFVGLVALSHDYVVAGFGRRCLDAAQHAREEMMHQLGHNHANRIAAARTEVHGKHIGFVVMFAGVGMDEVTGFPADVGLSLSALDTVDGETFNARAISLMVICGLFISMISIFSQR